MIFCYICSYTIFVNIRLVIWFLELSFYKSCHCCFLTSQSLKTNSIFFLLFSKLHNIIKILFIFSILYIRKQIHAQTTSNNILLQQICNVRFFLKGWESESANPSFGYQKTRVQFLIHNVFLVARICN